MQGRDAGLRDACPLLSESPDLLKGRVRVLSERVEKDRIDRELARRNRPLTEKLDEALKDARTACRFIDVNVAEDTAAKAQAQVTDLVATPCLRPDPPSEHNCKDG